MTTMNFFFLTLKIAADCGQNKTMENPPKKKIKQKKERSLNQTSKYLPLNMMDFTKLYVKKIKQIEILQRGMDVVKAMERNKNYIIEKKTGFTTSFDVDQRVLTSLPTSKKNTK